MNDITMAVIAKGRDLAILKNSATARARDQGVLFGRYQDEHNVLKSEAWVITELALIRWSECDLQFPEDAPFWSYTENAFTENTSSFKDINDLRGVYLEYRRVMKDSFLLPVNTIAAAINNAFDNKRGEFEKIEKSRTIFRNNPGLVFEKEILLKFQNGQFTNPSLPTYEFRPVAESNVQWPYQEGIIYRVNKLNQEHYQGTTIVDIDVRDIYFKDVIELLIHETKTVYMPKSDREILDSSNYDPSRVIRIPYLKDKPINGYSFDPIHLDTTALFYGMRSFEGYDFVEAFVSPNSYHPIWIKGSDPSKPDFPVVEVIISTIDPKIRGYIK